MALTEIFIFLRALVATYTVFFALLWLWRRYTSTIKHVPGPKSSNFIFGALKEVLGEDIHSQTERWAEKYGHVVKLTTLFGEERLSIADTKALNHILLKHSYDYPKDDGFRWMLSKSTGHGILFVEGEKHKNQRKLMNPAFGLIQLRELTEIFVEKAAELSDILDAECTQSPNGETVIDVVSWLNRLTLDVIGLAGFNYEFNSLRPDGPPNELNQAFAAFFKDSPVRMAVLNLQLRFPILRKIPLLPARELMLARATKTMNRIGRQLVEESRSALLGTGEKGDGWTARDILSLLIRANLATEEKLRMDDFEVMSQIATFLLAGHETTSHSTTWALHTLSLNPDIQTKLRKELLTLDTQNPTMDELNSLTYLEWFIKESLRYHSPVATVTRCASKDDVIPLSRPYIDTKGLVHDTIRVKKGQIFVIPILAINVSKELWGPDAMEFKPERWGNPPESISSIPGVFSNLLSFIGGPRACIGYRFSIIEMKAILFHLIRNFEFTPAVPKEQVGRARGIVGRAFVKGDGSGARESSLPITIKRYRGDTEWNEKS